MSDLEDELAFQLKAAKIHHEREVQFCHRRWRFDFTFPPHKIALEVEGGLFVQGRHSRGAGALKDMEKYNEAAILGWRVLRVGSPHIKSGQALEWVETILTKDAK